VSDAVATHLDELSRADPTSAPLARLQAEVLRAAADPIWARGVPDLDAARAYQGLPLLHDQTLRVDRDQARRLLDRLAALAERDGQPHAPALGHALAASRLDPLALLAATIRQDADALLAAAQDDLDPALLATLGHLLAVPLLRACGERAAPLLTGVGWDAGYCPVCAAWPALAELRGLERDHWLRCARCGAGWR
jgi:FdhE protein